MMQILFRGSNQGVYGRKHHGRDGGYLMLPAVLVLLMVIVLLLTLIQVSQAEIAWTEAQLTEVLP